MSTEPNERSGFTPKKPLAPEALSLLINVLARYARNVQDKTPLDKEIEDALKEIPNSRQLASQMIKNFESKPIQIRQQFLGSYSNTNAQKITSERFSSTFRQLSKSNLLPSINIQRQIGIDQKLINLSYPNLTKKAIINRDSILPNSLNSRESSIDKSIIENNDESHITETKRSSTASSGSTTTRPPPAAAPPPAARPLPKYLITYEGMYCGKETSEWSSSDEIYIFTTIFGFDSNGLPKVLAPQVKIPLVGVYENVDKGEYRNSPQVLLWRGTVTKPISIYAVVMENDQGDPDYYKGYIQTAINATIKILRMSGDATAMTIGEVVNALRPIIVDTVTWLTGAGDDIVGEDGIVLTPADVRHIATRPENCSNIFGMRVCFDPKEVRLYAEQNDGTYAVNYKIRRE